MTSPWTDAEARERASFVLGIPVDADAVTARVAYLDQLRLHAGAGEREATARNALRVAWAVWNGGDLFRPTLTPGLDDAPRRHGRGGAAYRATGADPGAAGHDDDRIIVLDEDDVIDLTDEGPVGVLRGDIEVVEVVRDRRTRYHVRAPDERGPVLVVESSTSPTTVVASPASGSPEADAPTVASAYSTSSPPTRGAVRDVTA